MRHKNIKNKNNIVLFLILIITPLLTSNAIAANSETIDSLKALLKSTRDFDKVVVYTELADNLWFTNPEKSKEYAYKAYEYSLSLSDDKSVALSTSILAISFYVLNEYDSATHYINISQKLYEELKDTLHLANNLRIIADIYSSRSENKSAQKYYIQSYNLYEKILNQTKYIDKINKLYPILLNNFATFYNDIYEPTNAMKYLRLSIDFYDKTNDLRGLAIAYFNIAINYFHQDNGDSTYLYLEKAMNISHKIGNKNIIAKSYQMYGGLYFENDNIAKSIKMLDSAIILYTDLNDLNGLAETYNQKSISLYRTNQFEKSLELQKECIKLAYKTDNKQLRLSGYQKASALYEKLKDYKNANVYLHKWHNLEDSLNEINNKVLIAELDKNFNFEKQERENVELKLQNELKEHNNARLSIVVFSLIIVLFLASIVIWLMRRKQRFEKTSNDLLAEKNNELELTNATKDKFFSIIAHDLRNPIGGFTKVVDLLQDENENLSSEERLELLELLNESSVHLSQLLENLLAWANTQRGLIKYNPSKINPYYIVETTINELKLTAKNKEITLNSDMTKDLYIVADANMINTLFRNLINNAIKFTPIGGTISVGYTEEPDKFIFSIKDTGVGMKQSTMDKLFKIGENNSTKGTNNERGTGLGLILCKEFVTKHNGKIWVESTLGEGSTFFFSIPKDIIG